MLSTSAQCKFSVYWREALVWISVSGNSPSARFKNVVRRAAKMGVSDEIVTHGDPKLLLAHYGLDTEGIVSKVVESLDILDEKSVGKTRMKVVK